MKKFLLYVIGILIFNTTMLSNSYAIKIAVSIKPLHSLVSMVTDGVVTPELIVKGNTSSHSIQLSAKNITTLNNSDLVFIFSKSLEIPIYQVVSNNNSIKKNLHQIIEFNKINILKFTQDNLIFKELHTHQSIEDIDYHVWLDPKNAIAILAGLADILSKKDPTNAKIYKSNATKYSKKIEELHLILEKSFKDYKLPSYILYHNGFSYLEKRYNIQSKGIIQSGCDASTHILGNSLSNKKLLQLSHFIKNNNVSCVFIEPEYTNKFLINFLTKNKIKYSIIDPIGYNIQPGKELYFNLLLNILNSFKECVS